MKLYYLVWKLVNSGYRTFYFGGYGDFDELCYHTVCRLKEEHPRMKIKMVYCVAQEKYLYKKVRYFNHEDYDEVIYLVPDFGGWYKSIYFRNCAMIDKSNYVIFYAEKRENSGAFKAYKYAVSKKKDLFNLYNGENPPE